jgi:glutamate racemase
MDARPIGVFDSGVGGLTVLHELLVTLPHEDAVYLGDNARLPYGPRPLAEVRRFALEVGHHLQEEGVKLVVVACNTATAAGLPDLQRALDVPVVGVLHPEAHAAALATRKRRVGLLPTPSATRRPRPSARSPRRSATRASTPSSSGARTTRSSGRSSSVSSAVR